MNTEQFDNLTRGLGKARTRRHALKLIAGTVFGGLLGFRGVADPQKSVVKAQAESPPSLQIELANSTQIQQYLTQAESDSDFLALRDYFTAFGFSRANVEGARIILDGSQEGKAITEILAKQDGSGVKVLLMYLEYPYSTTYLPIVTRAGPTNLESGYSARTPGIVEPTGGMKGERSDETKSFHVIYSVTLDSNGVPVVAHYRDSSAQIATEYPSRSAGHAVESAYGDSSLQDEGCQRCKDWCQSGITNRAGAASICGWSLSFACFYLGLLAAGVVTEGAAVTVAEIVIQVMGAGCLLVSNAACPLLNPPTDCDRICEEACRNCVAPSNSHAPNGFDVCIQGVPRVICGNQLCDPHVKSCTTDSNGKEICTPPEDACQPNWHFVGYYRFGNGTAPACCWDGGINCGASPDGYWAGCCPNNMRCVGGACRFN
jgi:hypothetical protein